MVGEDREKAGRRGYNGVKYSVRIAHSVRAPSSKRGSAKGEGSSPG